MIRVPWKKIWADDPIKAGDYGIKNLKYIHQEPEQLGYRMTSRLNTGRELYNQIVKQYGRYLQNVVYCIGGIYLTEAKDGSVDKRFRSVPREKQKAAMKWVMKQLQDNDWLDNREVCSKFKLNTKASSELNASIAGILTKIYMNVTLSSYLAEKNPYTLREFFDDFYTGAWMRLSATGSLPMAIRLCKKHCWT